MVDIHVRPLRLGEEKKEAEEEEEEEEEEEKEEDRKKPQHENSLPLSLERYAGDCNKTAVICQVDRRLPRQRLANQACHFELDALSDATTIDI